MATERPILFSAPMVRAILEGRKTQTRRAFNERTMKLMRAAASLGEVSWFMNEGCLAGNDLSYIQQFSPYGQPGDRLWVREAFRFLDVFDSDSPATVGNWCLNAGYRNAWAPTHYEADAERRDWQHVGTPPHDSARPTQGKLRPGIHMPRWASRILLEVTAVRVERLQDISEADARAEGARECDPVTGREVLLAGPSQRGSFVLHYRDIWEQINGAGSWSANPWVWVIEFRRADANSIDGLRAEVERPCCGTFHGSQHRITCEKYRGRTTTGDAQ